MYKISIPAYQRYERHSEVKRVSLLNVWNSSNKTCIQAWKIEVVNRPTDSFRDLEDPTANTMLETFIGLYNFFMRLLTSLWRISPPRSTQLRKTHANDFLSPTTRELQYLQRHNKKLISLPVLTPSRRSLQYTLDCETWDWSIGFLQQQKR